jgi:hypothetical protein
MRFNTVGKPAPSVDARITSEARSIGCVHVREMAPDMKPAESDCHGGISWCSSVNIVNDKDVCCTETSHSSTQQPNVKQSDHSRNQNSSRGVAIVQP